jgi:hypothetical protein
MYYVMETAKKITTHAPTKFDPVTLFTTCQQDSDCVAINNPSCCKVCNVLLAVNKQYASNYTELLQCKGGIMCMVVCRYPNINDVAVCSQTSHRCEMREPTSLICNTPRQSAAVVVSPPEIHTCPANYICSTELKGSSGVGHCFNKIPCNNANKPCTTGLQCVDDPSSDKCTGQQASCGKICAPNYQVNFETCSGLYPAGNCTNNDKDVCVDDPRDSCVPEYGDMNCPGICAPAITLCDDMKCNSNEKCIICNDPNQIPSATCVKRKKGGKCPPMPKFCGGIAGIQCVGRDEYCVDNPYDNCNPAKGGADCGGICVKKTSAPSGSSSDPCALMRCKAGTHCDPCNGHAQCVTDGGSCIVPCNLNCVKNKPKCTICDGHPTCLATNGQCPSSPPSACNLLCTKDSQCKLCGGQPMCLPTGQGCPKM